MGERPEMKPRRRQEKGFTLIEVMVALVVFLIGFLGMAGLLSTVVQANRGASNHTRADQVLYEKIEELVTTPYAQVASGGDQDTVGDVVFTRQWTVSPNDPIGSVMTIDLVARWTERGDTFQVSQTTMKSAN
jgi:prepilin-type N-terminal cleavage/methylation domain-containing protein